MSGSGDSPQRRAALRSGENRRRRAAERKALEAARAEYPLEHARGEHDERPLVGCPLCADRIRAILDAGGE